MSIDIESNLEGYILEMLKLGYTPYYIILEEEDINKRWDLPGYRVILRNGLNNILQYVGTDE